MVCNSGGTVYRSLSLLCVFYVCFLLNAISVDANNNGKKIAIILVSLMFAERIPFFWARRDHARLLVCAPKRHKTQTHRKFTPRWGFAGNGTTASRGQAPPRNKNNRADLCCLPRGPTRDPGVHPCPENTRPGVRGRVETLGSWSARNVTAV